ncbi:jg22486, partial [Pararge aegeria aegeria]
KTSPKTNTAKEQRDKDDSSSEEEKQWFTTKEKLLKRLEKKQECPSVDDAKRAKIVSEFIEKRSDGPQIRLR